MNKVLIISLYFPPMVGAGSLRLGKFAKYLPDYGWEPVVLTTTIRQDYARDNLCEVDEAKITRVSYRAPGFALKKKLSTGEVDTPNRRQPALWLKASLLKAITSFRPVYHRPELRDIFVYDRKWELLAYERGVEIIRREKPAVLYASTSYSIAARLSRTTGVPWIAEYRDLWSQNPINKKILLLQILEERKEKRTMETSAAMVTISPTLARCLESLHRRRVAVITNGFDSEDYNGPAPLTSRFTLTFIGGLKDKRRIHTPFFEAIGELCREGTVSSQNLELRFFGTDLESEIRAVAQKFGIGDTIRFHGWIPFEESIKKQKESTALFFMLGPMGPTEYGVCPGKVFEYLGAGRPILGCAPDQADISKIVVESGCGTIAEEKEKIKEVLRCWIREFTEKGEISYRFSPRPEIVNGYDRKELTRKLAHLLQHVTNCPPSR